MISLGRKLLSTEDCKYVLTEKPIVGGDQVLMPIAIRRKLDWTWTRELQEVEVKIFKDNLIMALKFARVYRRHQLYHRGIQIILNNEWYEDQFKAIETHFGSATVSSCKFNISISQKNVHYLSGFSQESGLNLQEFCIPGYTSFVFKKEDENVYLEISQEQNFLVKFCFNVFKILLKEFGEKFLKENGQEVKTKIGSHNYIGLTFVDYFNRSKFLGIFDTGQANEIIESEFDRFRYNDEPIELGYTDKEVYFTTEFEYNSSNKTNILFADFIHFVEDYSGNRYSVTKTEDHYYKLIFKDMKLGPIHLFTVKKSLREFAFKTFLEVHRRFGDGFLDLKKSSFTREHNTKPIIAVGFSDYFGTKKIFAVFESLQDKKSLKTGTSIRYQPLNLEILGEKFIYFSAQWSHPQDKSHPSYDEFVHFIKDYGQGLFEIVYNEQEEEYSLYNYADIKISEKMLPLQKIFFGPPGTGKSHQIKINYPGNWPRVTFHPELDYQGFIGAYKPFVLRTAAEDKVTYRFVEEAFIRAYCESWRTNAPYYLIIEEINRGNCAQIFGDIFQLLDRRDDGFSEYPIICSPDVQQHLREKLTGMERISEYFEKSGKDDFSQMSLPNNLNILCTMNTSDQSLFPMDSAFKRRWDWQYVPIDYEDATKFEIDLQIEGTYNWGIFISEINKRLKEHTQSEDKQLGNRFVSSVDCKISADQFVSKVLFYLWSEIYKEEHGTGNSIFKLDDNSDLTFGDFFDKGKVNLNLTKKFIEHHLPTTSNETVVNAITTNFDKPGEIDSEDH